MHWAEDPSKSGSKLVCHPRVIRFTAKISDQGTFRS